MKILYVCNDGAYFAAHRLWLAREAARHGAQVHVACGGDARLADGGLGEARQLEVVRHSFDLRSDLRLAVMVRRLAREVQADVVHLITIKPVLFGLLGLVGLRGPARIVVTFPGLGRIFDQQESSPKARLRRWLVTLGLKLGLAPRRIRAVFETASDRDLLVRDGVISPDKAVHIPGAGVDPVEFEPRPVPQGPLRVLYAGRLLHAKGVAAFAEAAANAAARGCEVEALIAGPAQDGDPDALSNAEIAALGTSRHVRFLGAKAPSDMPPLLASVHAVVLPTRYQEGVPRILIEAAAVGRMAVASDIPGCRAIVEHGVSGILLPDPSPDALTHTLIQLAGDRSHVERLCAGALRGFAERGFAQTSVAKATLALYPWPAPLAQSVSENVSRTG